MPADHDLTPRERAAEAIMANPEWSDRAIAREAAVSITTVRNARSRIPPKLGSNRVNAPPKLWQLIRA